ncbi:hypothetical protein VTK73DRAFT_5685 [Phialemonium thermophilum]|uniref:Protein kinase domain-containing protein n=1 Tax=Phialemonium thermophilum TaxID=223376 RepID=A0ABR3V1Q4_9PEZI
MDEDLPRYSSKGISIVETLVQGPGSVVGRVLVDGTEMLGKVRGRGLHGSSLHHELSRLHQIRQARLHQRAQVRVPPLLGYITHPEAGCVVGFVRAWIPGERLKDAVRGATPERRRKWASQVREAVDQLHEMGVVWGDGKPSNVVVDESDDVWLIDLEGGCTEGWVDPELADTVEGDEQAVRRITSFLRVEEGS